MHAQAVIEKASIDEVYIDVTALVDKELRVGCARLLARLQNTCMRTHRMRPAVQLKESFLPAARLQHLQSALDATPGHCFLIRIMIFKLLTLRSSKMSTD